MIRHGWGWAKPPLGSVLNPSHPLSHGLLGAYLLNEGAGLTAYGQARDGTITMTGQTRECGIQGLGITGADGTTHAASAATAYSALTTAVVRFVRTNTPSTLIYAWPLVSHHTTDGVASDWYLYIKPSDSKLRIDIPWVAGEVVTGSAAIATQVPYTIAFTRSGSAGAWTYTLYINGIQDATAGTASNPAGNAEANNLLSLSVGQTTSDHDPCGNLSLYLRYGRVLTPAELLWIHRDPYAMYAPPALPRWARRAAA